MDHSVPTCRQKKCLVGIWSVVQKFSAAIGVGAGQTILGVAGYVPGGSQPPEVIQALKVLYAIVPSVCNVVAFAIALTFPISRQAHQRILESIALLKQGQPVVDPLR